MAFLVGTRVAQREYSSFFRHYHRRLSCRLAENSENDNTSIREAKYQELMNASRLSLAPMMEYTDRHFRHLVRLISSQTLLYTEMVSANALSHERRDAQQAYREENPQAGETHIRNSYDDQFLRRYLGQGCVEPLEGPSVLQLGGSDPQQLYDACQTIMDMTARGWCDYTAINLNCGCPSPKVAGKGCFGAALMDDPELVADLTQAMHDGCGGRLPITVKCRIGTDSKQAFTRAAYHEMDPEREHADLCHFLETVAANGIVSDFSIHARIAVLARSFSPADNRNIPPLKYNLVHRLVDEYPDLNFSLNGGMDNLLQAQSELNACPGLAGVMIGRGWAADPWGFAMADRLLYDKETSDSGKNRLDILKLYGQHADKEEATWDRDNIRIFIVTAVTQLFAGEANARKFRIALDEIAGMPKKLKSQGKSLEGTRPLSELILNAAMEHLSEEALFRTPEESYERIVWEEKKRKDRKERSQTLTEWQTRRKLEEESTGSSYLAPAEEMISRASTNLS
jgi:tRNA-dihydrouridine synthase A